MKELCQLIPINTINYPQNDKLPSTNHQGLQWNNKFCNTINYRVVTKQTHEIYTGDSLEIDVIYLMYLIVLFLSTYFSSILASR